MGMLTPDADERAEAARDRDRDRNIQQRDVAGQPDTPFTPEGKMRTEFIREVTADELDQGTITKLSNLLSKDFVLGNYSGAEFNELRWLSRQILMEVEDVHPSEETLLTGTDRQVFFDDERQGLPALDDAQRATMFQFIQGVISRASRSKDGFQWEQLAKSVKVSEIRDGSDDDMEGWI